MNKIIKFFMFIPFVKRQFERGYSKIGFGLYFINTLYTKILGINKSNFLVHYCSKIQTASMVKISDKDAAKSVYTSFAVSAGCYYQAVNGIDIGEGTIWAHGCKFISTNHSYKDYTKPVQCEPIRIGKYVWIASNVVILPGVQIGDYAIVGAGSIVTKNIENYHIVAGNPAKVIATRCPKCLDKIPLKSKDNSEHICQ